MLIAIFIMLTVLVLLKVAELVPQWRELPPRELRKEQREVKAERLKNDLDQQKEQERLRTLMKGVDTYDGKLR